MKTNPQGRTVRDENGFQPSKMKCEASRTPPRRVALRAASHLRNIQMEKNDNREPVRLLPFIIFPSGQTDDALDFKSRDLEDLAASTENSTKSLTTKPKSTQNGSVQYSFGEI